jgi:hypothetical protein
VCRKMRFLSVIAFPIPRSSYPVPDVHACWGWRPLPLLTCRISEAYHPLCHGPESYMSLICDNNAPCAVPDELVRAVGPDAATRQLGELISALRVRLE